MVHLPTTPDAVAADILTDGVEARAERAAGRTGVESAEIERLPFDLSALEDEGVFVVRRVTRS